MRKIAKSALVAAGVAALMLTVVPYAALAAGLGSGKNSVTCKSGKQVKNPKACKENGGKA
jgi:hypothetical protein